MTAAVATLTEAQRREAWLEDRRKAITGTDTFRIMLNEDGGKMRVWLEKRGLAKEVIPNERMRWGIRLQSGILQGYSEEFGVPVEEQDPYTLHRIADCPILGASLDGRWTTGDRRPVDAKNVGWRREYDPATGEGWGEDMTDQVPFRYALQATLQAMACGSSVGEMAPLFGGNRIGRFLIPRDPEVEAAIREVATTFWQRHVLADVPPPVDGTEGWSDFLKVRYQKAGKDLLEATEEDVRLIQDRIAWKEEEKHAQAKIAAVENRLKARIGEAAGIAGVCTWKNNKDSQGTDWEALAKELLIGFPGMEGTWIAKHTTTKPGARVLRTTFKEAK